MAHRYFGRKMVASVVALSSIFSINFAPMVGAAADTCTWTGAGMTIRFSDPDNWTGCDGAGIPENGDSIVFDGSDMSLSVTQLLQDIVNPHFSFVSVRDTYSSGRTFVMFGDSFATDNIVSDTDFRVEAPLSLSNGGSGTMINIVNGKTVTMAGPISEGRLRQSGLGTLSLTAQNDINGGIEVAGGTLEAQSSGNLGSLNNAITLGSDSTLRFAADCPLATGLTLSQSLVLSGTGHTRGGVAQSKVVVGDAGCTAQLAYDERYGITPPPADSATTLSGAISLAGDVTVGGGYEKVNITGALSGEFKLKPGLNFGGILNIDASSNTSSTVNGEYMTDRSAVVTLSDSRPNDWVGILNRATVSIDGARGNVDVRGDGILRGTGSVDALSVSAGATIAPGHSPGCLSTGDISIAGSYQFELVNSGACTGYDQIRVTGSVVLNDTSAQLDVAVLSGYSGAAGDTYTIIDNDGTSDPVDGTFSGLPEGSMVNINGGQLRISYSGGDGNDVTLTVVTVPSDSATDSGAGTNSGNTPGVPDTGFKLITSNPLLTLLFATLGAGALMFAARRARA